jgi:hypothetical protein
MNKFKIEKQKHERLGNKGEDGKDNKCDVCNKELHKYHYVIHNNALLPIWAYGWVCSKRCVEMRVLQLI